jgi:hypothetical protein
METKNLSKAEISFMLKLGCIILLAFLLRFLHLSGVFFSSDNVELPARIVVNTGYRWMLSEPYGVLINVFTKLFVGFISLLGIGITEFWWKAPIALLGSLQIPLTFLFLRKCTRSRLSALIGAMAVSVLPIHVMQSRYPWGYEVFGVFFVTLSFWALFDFFQQPTYRSGFVASFFCAMYLISHGYIIPFFPCLILFTLLFVRKCFGLFQDLWKGIKLLLIRWVWFFPILTVPMVYFTVQHTLEKPTRLGFFVLDHLSGFVGNMGLPLTILGLMAVASALWIRSLRTNWGVFFAVGGVFYLAPLFFGTPPGITLVRGYMLMGGYLWTLCMVCVMDVLISKYRKVVVGVAILSLLLTSYGTVRSIWRLEQWPNLTSVSLERGGIGADPGTKTAAYFVRRYVSDDQAVLALHRAVEPPNLIYYFERFEYAYYDLDVSATIAEFSGKQEAVDVIICEEAQRPYVANSGRFVERIVIYSQGVPRMWIYARPDVGLPSLQVNTEEMNLAFDETYRLSINLLPGHRGGIWFIYP